MFTIIYSIIQLFLKSEKQLKYNFEYLLKFFFVRK